MLSTVTGTPSAPSCSWTSLTFAPSLQVAVGSRHECSAMRSVGWCLLCTPSAVCLQQCRSPIGHAAHANCVAERLVSYGLAVIHDIHGMATGKSNKQQAPHGR